MSESAHRLEVDGRSVSALFTTPHGRPRFVYVFAHGAGAGMTHPFMTSIATRLAARGVATLRYNFPYMEAKKGRVDTPPIAWAAVRAAVARARELQPQVPLIAGGKSFGGRMTSQAQADAPLPGVVGLAFFGFPLHPPGKPGIERAEHLGQVTVPMLFLQGTRDEFATPDLLQQVRTSLGVRATVELVEGGDHSFAVPKARARSAGEVHESLCDALVRWAGRL